MIKLHHLNNSRSTRIIWLLEELALDYELVIHERQPNMLAPAALKAIHPLGKAPILEDIADDDPSNKRVVVESGAIIEYVLHQYDPALKLRPVVGSNEWWDYLFWLHFAEGSAVPPLLLSLVFSKVKERAPRLVKPIANGIAKTVMSSFVKPNINNHNQLIEKTLSESPWFAGEKLTGADIQMSFVIESIKHRDSIDNYPAMKQWLQKVRSRPAYQTALKKGGEVATS